MEFKILCALVIGAALLEAILILADAVPPIASYSPTNILFSFLQLFLVAYFAWEFSGPLRDVVLKSALAGALVALVFIVASFAGMALGRSVFGVPMGSGIVLVSILLLNIIFNSLLFAIVAAVSNLIGSKLREKPAGKKRK